MNEEKFEFIIGERESGKRTYEKINNLVRKLHRLTTDYKNGWLSYKQYKIHVETIKNEIEKVKKGN